MPTREYLCERCEHNYDEFFTSIAADHPTECPKCGEPYGDIFRQVYHAGIGLVKNEPKTFGQQAELNAKRLGTEQMQKLREADQSRFRGETNVFDEKKIPKGGKKAKRPKKEIPWFRSDKIPGLKKLDKPLELSRIKDTKKYIRTGETT